MKRSIILKLLCIILLSFVFEAVSASEETISDAVKKFAENRKASSPNTPPKEAIMILRALKKQTEGLGVMEIKERIRSTPGVQDAMIAEETSA
ncbi:hypothetical protein D4S03_12295 [bacterium]|nr:MAG: hypothetical protein D4S03_12295 [bacterium]